MPPTFTHGPVPEHLHPLTADDPARVGPFRVVGRLGSGGMGTVYAAADSSGRCVAVKVIHPSYTAEPEFRARLAREAELLTRVRGRCTVRVLGADTGGPHPWLATEFVPGRTLDEHVRSWGRLAAPMVLGVAAGTAEALTAAHAAGVVHRDLKPGNVILSPRGPVVLDFGIARAADDTAVTATGALLGTPGWIAPEQYEEGGEVGSAADVFAWGALTAFAATGREPFGTGAAEILAYRVAETDPDLEGVPDALRPVVAQALDRDPEQRPDAQELLSAVYALWNGGPPEAPVPAAEALDTLLARDWDGIPPPRLAAPRRRTGAVAAGAAVLALATGAVGYLAHDHGPLAAPPAAQAAQDPAPSEGQDAAEAEPQAPVEVNGYHLTAIDGEDTFVTGEDGEVVWIVQMLQAETEGEGMRFTGVATYQHMIAGTLGGDNFHVSDGEDTYPAAEGPLTGELDAWSGSQTVSFTVPDAPEQGMLLLQGHDYEPGQPGFPPLGLCYAAGEGFHSPAGDGTEAEEVCP